MFMDGNLQHSALNKHLKWNLIDWMIDVTVAEIILN